MCSPRAQVRGRSGVRFGRRGRNPDMTGRQSRPEHGSPGSFGVSTEQTWVCSADRARRPGPDDRQGSSGSWKTRTSGR
jgi:hypothetical protein